MVKETQVRYVRSLKSIECNKFNVEKYPNARTCSVIHKSGNKKTLFSETDVAVIDLTVDGDKKIGYGVGGGKPHNYRVGNCQIEITNRYWSDGKEKMFPTHAEIHCWSD